MSPPKFMFTRNLRMWDYLEVGVCEDGLFKMSCAMNLITALYIRQPHEDTKRWSCGERVRNYTDAAASQWMPTIARKKGSTSSPQSFQKEATRLLVAFDWKIIIRNMIIFSKLIYPSTVIVIKVANYFLNVLCAKFIQIKNMGVHKKSWKIRFLNREE